MAVYAHMGPKDVVWNVHNGGVRDGDGLGKGVVVTGAQGKNIK